jgi:hypothetical protein
MLHDFVRSNLEQQLHFALSYAAMRNRPLLRQCVDDAPSQTLLITPHRDLCGNTALRTERHFDQSRYPSTIDTLPVQFQCMRCLGEDDIGAF